MKRKIKRILISIFCFLFRWTKEKPTVLMYHSITSDNNPFSISPKEFEKQIKYLKENNFKFLNTKDLDDLSKLPNKSVLITFDDGYENVFINAVPILKKYNIPAVFFISTNVVGEEINGVKIMNWEQIKFLSESSLFEIGCHGHNHIRFTSLKTDDLADQLMKSKNILEEKCGKSIKAISFPFGRSNQDVLKKIKEIGYFYGFGVKIKNLSKQDDILCLPRIAVDESVFSDIFFKDILKIGYSLYWQLRRFFIPKNI